MKRDSEDEQWKETKRLIAERDKGKCRLIQILNPKDFMILKKNAGKYLFINDPAHIFPVSTAPKLMYNSLNVVTLNRYSHSNLDSCRSPISGEPISKEERNSWWKKIVGSANYTNLERLERNDFND